VKWDNQEVEEEALGDAGAKRLNLENSVIGNRKGS
jgi:hypothetical protein